MTTDAMRVASYMRQSAILNPDKAADLHATVCGVGTVGSNVAEQFARAGIGSLELWDMDDIEHHNIPSQAFTLDDLHRNKAEVMAERVKLFSHHIKVSARPEELMGGEIFKAGIIVSAVDSMEMRKRIYETAKGLPGVKWLLDFRMGGNLLQAWCVELADKTHQAKYEKKLWGSDQVVEAPCGGRTFAPVGAMAGSFAMQFVTKILRESDEDRPPFHLYVDMDSFTMMPVG